MDAIALKRSARAMGSRTTSGSIVRYWMAILRVRWWGTSVGDILSFALSPVGSAIFTGVLLLAVLTVRWSHVGRLSASGQKRTL